MTHRQKELLDYYVNEKYSLESIGDRMFHRPVKDSGSCRPYDSLTTNQKKIVNKIRREVLQYLTGDLVYGQKNPVMYHRPKGRDWGRSYITFGVIETFEDLKYGKDELIKVDCFISCEFDYFIEFREFWWEEQKRRHIEDHPDKRVYGLWNKKWSNSNYPKKGMKHKFDTSRSDEYHQRNQWSVVRYKNGNIRLEEVRGKSYSRINL
tara:strand:+ start:965 stop:1585 length:621 start_codon:yes stop_codon:yes gene_type:complete